MAVRLVDIAERAGVSFGAVSQVLRNPKHPRFTAATRARVLRIASEMGYRPNRIAGGLRTGRTDAIALVLPWNNTEMLDAAERHTSEAGLRLMVQFTPSPDVRLERRAIQTAVDWRVDGLIWLPFGARSDHADLTRQVRQSGIHVALLERHVPQLPDAYVVKSNYHEGFLATIDHLCDQGYGEIAFMMPSDGDFPVRRYRRTLFKALMRRAGRPHRLIWGDEPVCVREVEAFIASAKGPVAIISDSDWGPIHIVEVAERMNVSIPEQLGIVGVGGMRLGGSRHVGELMRPTITNLYRPATKMMRLAVDAVIGQIQAAGTGRPYVNDLFQSNRHTAAMTLTCRDSTRRLPSPDPARLSVTPAARPEIGPLLQTHA